MTIDFPILYTLDLNSPFYAAFLRKLCQICHGMSAEILLDAGQERDAEKLEDFLRPAPGVEAKVLVTHEEDPLGILLPQSQGFVEVLAKVVAHRGQVPAESLPTPRNVDPGLHETPGVAEEEDDLEILVPFEELPKGSESKANGLHNVDRICITCLQ